jgi:hypothetical protein
MVSSDGLKLPRRIPATVRGDLETRARDLGVQGREYIDLFLSLADEIKPEDVIEYTFLKQAVDHAWHTQAMKVADN